MPGEATDGDASEVDDGAFHLPTGEYARLSHVRFSIVLNHTGAK